jgi:hypothetical protein
MRKQDIRTGVVYAYQRSSWSLPVPLVFLSLDLHRRLRPRAGADSWCQPSTYGDRPKAALGFSDADIGYPVARLGWNRELTDDALAALPSLGAEVASGDLPGWLQAAGIERDILTRMASVIGPYDEVMAEREVRLHAEAERTRRENAGRQDKASRARAVIRALGAQGVKASYDEWDVTVTLSLDEAEKVVTALARTEDGR